MKSLGSTLFILGVLAFGLNYMNAVPKVLAWIYEWGEDTAMWIKAGITGGGALLWLAGNFLEKPAEVEAEPEEEEE
ncbi:TPA: cell division protein [Neisseria subflava]|jgi:cell division ABC efflux transporter, permease protein ftsX